MDLPTRWKHAWEPVLSLGAYEGEPEIARGGRRVFVVAFVIATVLSIPIAAADIASGYPWVGGMNLVVEVITVALLIVVHFRPRWFASLVSAMFAVIWAGTLVEIALFGGLLPSGLVVIFGLPITLVILMAVSLRASLWWFGVFVVSVAFAALIPRWVDPIYELADPEADVVMNLIMTGIITIAIVAYFVRQRDRFQRRSDDLLHAILPDDIVPRMKDGATIADDIASASVLFADVVDFTPMSAAMTPAQLVGLLDEVFTCFDAFVEELGLEKIKTVGDAYMAAAGVPRPRDDHAHAIAELALKIRDHEATNPVDGRRLAFRIGVASGPVTAGVIGTRTFAYDLWGDTVNTASRMESSGVPGRIQVTEATYELIKDRFACEPRGPVEIKGKSTMETYLLAGPVPNDPLGQD
jgi:guanylate cyclase